MFRIISLVSTLCVASILGAQDQITIQKVTVNTPSGVITGKVVGTGDRLVFIDDTDPAKSFTLNRGEVRDHRSENGAIFVEMARPAADQAGTTSNLRITVVDEANATAITKWFSMPVERSRTITTYSTDVRHDHKGQGHCNGKLIADDTGLRFASISEASHSQSWNYNDVQSFEKEKDHSLLKIKTKAGETYDFKTVNGATAGALYDLVAQKIVANRSAVK
jgi:hypothetical protein